LAKTRCQLEGSSSSTLAPSLVPLTSSGDVSAPSSKPESRSVVRPSHLPPSVLWTWEDCLADPLSGLTKSNKSRPVMQRALRTEGGTGIALSQWRAIRNSACAVARSALSHLVSCDPRAASMPRRKKYFKTFFPEEWEAALIKLEGAADLLTLCAGRWKADMTLGTVLAATISSRPPSSLSSSRPSPSPLLQRPHLPSQPAPARGPQTQKMPVGNKNKRPRDPSPQRRRKKAKSSAQSGEDKDTGTYTYFTIRTGLIILQTFQVLSPRPNSST
jgi:hypothetical protein